MNEEERQKLDEALEDVKRITELQFAFIAGVNFGIECRDSDFKTDKDMWRGMVKTAFNDWLEDYDE